MTTAQQLQAFAQIVVLELTNKQWDITKMSALIVHFTQLLLVPELLIEMKKWIVYVIQSKR